MLAEWLQYLTTPCPTPVRRLGYLKQAIGLQARARRCARAWQPHLEECRAVIEAAVAGCGGKRRAVVIGSGLLRELPLERLARSFEETLLVDIVQLWPARLAVRRHPKLKLVQADVTGLVGPVFTLIQGAPRPAGESSLPHHMPNLFLDDPPDLVVSANVVSQLPLLLREALETWDPELPARELDAFSRSIVNNHLIWLHAFPGRVALIADVERQVHDGETIVEREDALFGVDFPYQGREWVWDLAPQPEVDARYGLRHRMVGIADLATSHC